MTWTSTQTQQQQQQQQQCYEEGLMMCPPPTELKKGVHHAPLHYHQEDERAFSIPPTTPLPTPTESPLWWQMNMTIMTNTTYGDLLEDDYDANDVDYYMMDDTDALFEEGQKIIYQHMSLPNTKSTHQRDVHEMFSRLQSCCM